MANFPVQFDFPELFLLAIPVAFAYWKWGKARGVIGWHRVVLLLLLLVALAGPKLNLGGRGVDVIVVVDRSRSMPDDSPEHIRELIANLENNRGPGDRLGVVTFGTQGHIEQTLKLSGSMQEYLKEVNPDGSDLNDALLRALDLVNPNRPARILVMADGEANGASPISAARRAREEGVPIDFRLFERLRVGDLAVESILLPRTVAPNEPFQFPVWIYADKDAEGTVTVLRDGMEIARTTRAFTSGMNRLLFRDLIPDAGFNGYTVLLDVPSDPLQENNQGAGVVRVEGGPAILVLNSDGAQGNLASQLAASGIPVSVAVAKDHPLTQDSLDRFRAVIVENVPANDFGRVKMERLAQFVEDLGGGLMLTGGERSFGTGGYFKSPLDEVLPVSMEMREEHRKNRLAMAIALDRSGSMSMPVAGGKTKMDLANLGTAECVRLLSPQDMVAVIAVDSSPHVVQALTPVDSPESIASKALRIESMGGGIFVYEALVAAGQELMKATDYNTRHIILFSDAQDSEEPGSYQSLLKKYAAAGITVSVIGLGTDHDVHAPLLKDIAKRGSGNIMFTMDPQELPRLFTQDTMSVARNTFIEKDPETQPNGIPGNLLPDARLMGELPAGEFPNVDGYNLSYLKPDATGAAITLDEYKAPLSAFWYRGLGRVAAITLEIDGPHTGQFDNWDGYGDFLITHSRWLLGGGSPDDVYTAIEQQGQDAVVTVELDPERGDTKRNETPKLVVVPPGDERPELVEPDFTWTGPHTLQARFRMDRTGTYRTLVKTSDGKFARGPAVTLPYSAEYVPRIDMPSGKDVLSAISQLTGGSERADILTVLHDPPRSARMVSLIPTLCAFAICLLILEIAGRRLSLWERLADAVIPQQSPATGARQAKAWWHVLSWPKLPKVSRASNTSKGAATSTKPSQTTSAAPPPKPAAPAEAEHSAKSVFEQAKQRARRRLK